MKSEENTKDGKKEGLSRVWRKNGQLDYEGNYRNGKEDGLWRYWHENGQLKAEGNFKDGNIISINCWDEKGNKIECD